MPLVARAQALWQDLARRSARRYFDACGGLFVGHPHEYHVAGSLASAQAAGLAHELLDRAEIGRRYPWLVVPEGMVGFVDPGAGVLAPERIVEDQLAAATALGAELRFDVDVRGFAAQRDGVGVETAADRFTADALVLCAGGWMAQLDGWTGPALEVERVTQHWFAEPAGVAPRLDAPVLLLSDGADHATAVFPARDGRIKVAGHGSARVGPIAALDRDVHADDVAGAERMLRAFMPRHAGAHVASSSCFYTRTPGGHFVIDRLPGLPQAVFASACNGYGFKFSTAVGEALAALALGTEPPVDVGPWRFA